MSAERAVRSGASSRRRGGSGPSGGVLAAVFVGGAVGTLLRAGLAETIAHDPDAWPWATFAVNLAGALLLGWWSVRLAEGRGVDRRARPLLATGLCGGLTTFSTLQLELVLMLDAGAVALAAAYASASIALGLALVVLGRRAARRTGGSASGPGSESPGPDGPGGGGPADVVVPGIASSGPRPDGAGVDGGRR